MVMRKWPDYAQVGMAAKAVVGSIVGRGNAEEVVSSSPYLSSSLDRAHLQVLGTKTVFVLTGISVGSKVATRTVSRLSPRSPIRLIGNYGLQPTILAKTNQLRLETPQYKPKCSL